MDTVFYTLTCVILCSLGSVHIQAHTFNTRIQTEDVSGLIIDLIERIEGLEFKDVQHSRRELQHQLDIDDLHTKLQQHEHTIVSLTADNVELQRRVQTLNDDVHGILVADVGVDHNTSRTTKRRKVRDITEIKRETVHHPVPRHDTGRTFAFSAKLQQGPLAVVSNQTVVFEVSDTNVGGAYNTSTGEFTAQLPGTYVFSVAITTFATFNMQCSLMKNEQIMAHFLVNGFSYSHYSNGQTVLMHLDLGDTVSVRNSAPGDAYVDGGGHSVFTGFLIVEDSLRQ